MAHPSGARIRRIRAAVLRRQGGPLAIESLTLEGPRDHEILVRISVEHFFIPTLDRLDAVRSILPSGGRTLAQGALAWILARSPRTVPIPGFRTVKQVDENAPCNLHRPPIPPAPGLLRADGDATAACAGYASAAQSAPRARSHLSGLVAVHECTCAPAMVTRYQKRISGPLLDPIDVDAEVPRVENEHSSNDELEDASPVVRRTEDVAPL